MLPPCSEQGHDPRQLPSPHRGFCPLPGPAAADGRGRRADRLTTKPGLGRSPPGPPPPALPCPPAAGAFGDQNLGKVLCLSHARDLSVADKGHLFMVQPLPSVLPLPPLATPALPAGSGSTDPPEDPAGHSAPSYPRALHGLFFPAPRSPQCPPPPRHTLVSCLVFLCTFGPPLEHLLCCAERDAAPAQSGVCARRDTVTSVPAEALRPPHLSLHT